MSAPHRIHAPARRRPRPAATRPLAVLIAAVATAGVGCSSSTGPAADGPTLAEYREIEPELIDRAQRHAARGDAAMADGELERAIDHYSRAVATYGQLAAGWNNLGVALMAAERYPEAEAAFRQGERVAPTDYRPIFNRGLLYYQRGFAMQAKPLFERAVRIDRSQLKPLWYAIRTHLLLNDLSEQTVEYIERAMMLETDERFLEKLRLERERIQRVLRDEAESEIGGRTALPDERAIDLIEADELGSEPDADPAPIPAHPVPIPQPPAENPDDNQDGDLG